MRVGRVRQGEQKLFWRGRVLRRAALALTLHTHTHTLKHAPDRAQQTVMGRSGGDGQQAKDVLRSALDVDAAGAPDAGGGEVALSAREGEFFLMRFFFAVSPDAYRSPKQTKTKTQQ